MHEAIGQLTEDLSARSRAFVEHNDREARFGDAQRGGHAARACADDADVRVDRRGRIHGARVHDLPPRDTFMPLSTSVMHARTTAPSMRTRHS